MNVVITYQTGKPFENHLRMRLRLTQLPFPHHLRLMDLILSTYPLLQQRHPLRVRIPADTDDAVKVQGKTGIVDDKPTPQHHTLTKPSNISPTNWLHGFVKVPSCPAMRSYVNFVGLPILISFAVLIQGRQIFSYACESRS